MTINYLQKALIHFTAGREFSQFSFVFCATYILFITTDEQPGCRWFQLFITVYDLYCAHQFKHMRQVHLLHPH